MKVSSGYANEYFQQLKHLVDELDLTSIDAFVEMIWKAYQHGETVFFMGNGGSASIASHLAADIGKNVTMDYKNEKEKRFRTMSLVDNVAWMTALANDNGYENVFKEQLMNFARPGDVAVMISSSGNSENVVRAALWAKANQMKVVAMVGFDGGKLKEIADVVVLVSVPKGDYGHVEGLHGDIHHYVVEALKKLKMQEIASAK